MMFGTWKLEYKLFPRVHECLIESSMSLKCVNGFMCDELSNLNRREMNKTPLGFMTVKQFFFAVGLCDP